MLRSKSSEPEVVDRSDDNVPQPKARQSGQQAKLQAEISKKMRKQLCNSETSVTSTPVLLGPSAQRIKVVGETTAETMSLLSATVENICPENKNNNNNNNALQTGTKPAVSSFQYHILAVDDSHIDQRVIEKLLKVSSYKG